MSLDLTSSIGSTDSNELSLFEEKAIQIAGILDDHGFGHFSEADIQLLESATDFESLRLVVGEIINDRLKK